MLPFLDYFLFYQGSHIAADRMRRRQITGGGMVSMLCRIILVMFFVVILPVVASMKTHVAVQRWNVFELSGANAALHHVLVGVRFNTGRPATTWWVLR